MKNYFAIKSIFVFLSITLFFSCAEPTTIGSELQETVDVFATDTFSLKMKTIREDSIQFFTPVPENAFSTFLCGNYQDEIMGEMSANIFTQLRVGSAPPSQFYTGTLDSVILHLPYQFNNYYGNPDAEYTFEVYRMTQAMDNGEIYYTNDSFMYDPTPIGSKTFKPATDPELDSMDYILTTEYINSLDSTVTDTSRIAQHLRIPIDINFGLEFINEMDSFLFNSVNFLDFLNGLHIRSINTEDEGMVAFDLGQFASAGSIGSGMTFFYSYPSFTGDTIFSRRHSLFTNSTTDQYLAQVNNAVSTFTPEVEDAFDQIVTDDSPLYIQGLIGPNIEVDIPDAASLKNTIINKAELTVTVASPDDIDRAAPIQVAVATRSEEGTYQAIDDVVFAISRGNLGLFGGREEENGSLRQYTFNLSAAFQNLADVENEPLYLAVFPKAGRVSRMTIYGPEHSQYPAKLNVVYTTLPE